MVENRHLSTPLEDVSTWTVTRNLRYPSILRYESVTMASKKAVKEKQKKAIEDSTFGLKNKNKSKKVQQFINRVEKSVKHSNGGAEATKAKDLKKEAKLAKQLQEEEMRQLFNEAIGNQFGVKKSKAQTNAAMLGLNTANKEVVEFLDGLSSDSSEDEDDDQNYQIELVRESEEVTSVEVFREKTIEDIIEEQRAKLAAEGKRGTPVTAESFAKWRAEKMAKKQAEAEARVKAEQLKKKGGKGLSVLSGKELFSYNASLFVDDESAFDTTNDKTITEEITALAKQEEERILEETRKAQAEQLRLCELQRTELEARQAREQAKRERALAVDHKSFLFGGVLINQALFEEEEEEDLEFFTDLPLPTPKSSSGAGGTDKRDLSQRLEQTLRFDENNEHEQKIGDLENDDEQRDEKIEEWEGDDAGEDNVDDEDDQGIYRQKT